MNDLKDKHTDPVPPLRRSLYVMGVSGLVAIVSFALSLYYFLGFLGDGRTLLGVIEAFLLCFGAGAFLYLPMLAVFFMARHVRAFGVKRRIGVAAILISLPLWGLGGAGLIIMHPFWLYALLVLLLGLFILFWGVAVLRARSTVP